MRTSLEIRRIDLWSFFKIGFFVYAAIGLIVGFFFAMFSVILSGLGDAFMLEDEFPFGILGGVVGIVAMPILAVVYGAIGAVMFTIVGVIYNLVSKGVGGLRFDADAIPYEEPPLPVAPQPPPPPTVAPAAPPRPPEQPPPPSAPAGAGGPPPSDG